MLPLIPVLLVLILRGTAGAGSPTQARLSAAINALHHLAAAPESEVRVRAMAMVSERSAETPESIYSILCEAASRATETSEPVERPEPPFGFEAPKPRDGFSECRRSRDGPSSC